MNYYNLIKNKIIDDEIYSKIKNYSKEKHKVVTYFEIGKILSEVGRKYGNHIIEDYSNKLVIEVGKKYNKRTLFRMKQFYNAFKDENVSTLSTQLTWSHYSELLPIKDLNKMHYYLKICIESRLDVRQLREKIKSNEYERLSIDARDKIINNEKLEIKEIVPNPILIRSKNNAEIISERILQKIILEDIPSFLKSLGNGFTFIDNEYKIKISDRYNYIDLLLFNIEYNSYVVVELKITELKKEHIGQIEVYMNYIDKNIKNINHNKTMGIIIVKKDNKLIMEYCSDSRIMSRSYVLI